MESPTRSHLLRVLVALCLCMSCLLPAQTKRRARIRFGKIELLRLPTPEFRETTHSKAKSEHEWIQIVAEYEASGGRGGWLDELEFRWYVLVKEPQGRFILLKTKATYLDVETKGEMHHVAAYIRPAFIRRYFERGRIDKDSVWIRVEAVENGRVVEKKTECRQKEPPGDWWKAKEPVVKLLPETLLTRDKTPFAPMDYDFYEHIKSSTGTQ